MKQTPSFVQLQDDEEDWSANHIVTKVDEVLKCRVNEQVLNLRKDSSETQRVKAGLVCASHRMRCVGFDPGSEAVRRCKPR